MGFFCSRIQKLTIKSNWRIPGHWCLSLSEMEYFNEIRINIENSKQLEEDTPKQKFPIKLNPDVNKVQNNS